MFFIGDINMQNQTFGAQKEKKKIFIQEQIKL